MKRMRDVPVALLVGLCATLAVPVNTQATIQFNYGPCNPSDGCDQSVNFTPANSGTTVTGDTNPPKPLYDVYIDSLEGLTLHGSGSTVDTGNPGPGFTSILIRPEAGYAWGAIEFQLDSMNNNQPNGTGGLLFTVKDNLNSFTTFSANFPWEGNKGENQHYHFHAIDGESILSLQIDYTDPLGNGNTINDIHNIDVNTVPEPTTLSLMGISLLAGCRCSSARSKRNKRATKNKRV